MAASKSSPSSGDAQSIEQLQKRYNELHRKQIEADTNLKNAEKQLADLRKEANEKYGTADLNALREKLAAMKAENEAKRKDYQASLDKIESDLAEVEQSFAVAETTSSVEKAK